MNRGKTLGDTIAKAVLLCAVVTLLTSVFALTHPSFSTIEIAGPTEAAQSNNSILHSSDTTQQTVLGEQSANTSCISEQEYFYAVSRARPEVTIYFGTEQTRMSGKELLSCALRATEENSTVCKKPILQLDTACIEKLFTLKGSFVPQEESLRSATTGKVISARINDNIVDFKLLSQQLADLYQKNSDSDVVMSPYVTAQLLSLQAPVHKNLPNTNGQAATRYLEFDGSRQLMFQWEKGKYKMYRMSGAFPEYNPVGVYTIINKSPLAWSSTANKWMPYWQAFTFDREQSAMLGIHALVYWYPGLEKTGGKKIYEPESNIGKPRSTGCLRLSIEDARKVFEWTKVGELVVVHD